MISGQTLALEPFVARRTANRCTGRPAENDHMSVETQQTSGPTSCTRPSGFFRFWRLLFVFLVMAHLYPIRFGILRLAMILAAVVVWFGVPLLIRKRRWVWPLWVAATLVVCALFLGPGRPESPQALRQEYVRSLQRYSDVRYVWGGENTRGVDCSGLVRAALIDADINRGISTLNPALMREACRLWWFDSSADALQKQYRHNTASEFIAPSLNRPGRSRILPGDLAVTESGQHVLAYIGDYAWIEADPYAMRVITIIAPSKSVWFDQPMRIIRWRQFR